MIDLSWTVFRGYIVLTEQIVHKNIGYLAYREKTRQKVSTKIYKSDFVDKNTQ